VVCTSCQTDNIPSFSNHYLLALHHGQLSHGVQRVALIFARRIIDADNALIVTNWNI
jgi:hypothetical protein